MATLADLTFVAIKGLSTVDLVYGGPFTSVAYLRQPLNGGQGAGDILMVPIGSYVTRDTSGTFRLATSAEVAARLDAVALLGTVKPTGLGVTQGEDPSGVSAAVAWTDGSSNPVEVWRAPHGNVVLQSENFGTTWAVAGGGTRTAAKATTRQGYVLDQLHSTAGPTDYYHQESVAFTGDGVKAVSFVVKAPDSPAAGGAQITLYDTTGAAAVLVANIVWTNRQPIVSATTGTVAFVDLLDVDTYRIGLVTTTVTAAHSNSLRVYPAKTTAQVGDFIIGAVQAEDAASPTPYVKTTTAIASTGGLNRFRKLGTVDAGVELFADATPDLGTYYDYKIRHVVNPTDYPDYSTFTAVASLAPVSEAISDLTAGSITDTTMTLTWTPAQAVAHKVYKNGVFVADVAAETGGTYDATLVEHTVSVWTVKGVDPVTGDLSPASNAVSVQSLLTGIPTNLALDSKTATTINLTFTVGNAAYSTEIWQAVAAGASTLHDTQAPTVATDAITGLTTATVYHHKARSKVVTAGVTYYSAFTTVLDTTTD